MAGVEMVVQFYKGWGIQVLVLLSFAMQVTLLITAEIRRRRDSGMLKVIVWCAYLMADSTAIYALGHMSVASRSPEQKQLMALWASFLLVHLGGQDNITAYAIEDVRLWLRHLQALVVQVAAAAYILYESWSAGSDSLLWRASILVFVVGVVKYGERVWALICANAKRGSKNYGGNTDHCLTVGLGMDPEVSTDRLLELAHKTLTVAGGFFNRPPKKKRRVTSEKRAVRYWYRWVDRPKENENVFTMVEMQMSLMHDVFYSKADVIHTWYGLLIRVISWASTAAALLLFHRPVLHSGYSRADVGVTYVLLAGALVLEATSLLRAIFSIWATRNMKFLRPVVSPLRRLVLPERRRWWWSHSMGQHNLFKLYDRRKKSRSSRIARMMKVEEPWNTMVHSSRIPFSQKLKSLLVELLYHYGVGNADTRKRIYEYCDKFGDIEMETMELHECILAWHVGTQVYLRWYKDEENAKDEELVEAIEALSNYMLFLVAARPDMLPKSAENTYSTLCYHLDVTKDISTDDFLRSLQAYGTALNRGISAFQLQYELDLPYGKTLQIGSQLGAKLIGGEGLQGDDMISQIAQKLGQSVDNSQEFGPGRRLKVVAFAWACMLFDASKSTDRDSHAKQLSNGGELLTVVALLMAHISIHRNDESSRDSDDMPMCNEKWPV